MLTRSFRVGLVGAACASLAAVSTGCATIISGTKEEVRVQSSPQGARISILDQQGEEAYSGNTPHTFELDKKEKKYTVKLKLDGYQEAEVRIRNDFNGWTICNIGCGGLIGFAVDFLDGAMWYLRPNHISVSLQQGAPPATPAATPPPPVAPPSGVHVIPGPSTRVDEGRASRVYALFVARDSEGQLRALAVPLVRETTVLASR